MNEDILKGKWKQVRGKTKEWWGELTDDDLDKIDGRLEVLLGLLQERYGLAREVAMKEVERRLKEMKDTAVLAGETGKG